MFLRKPVIKPGQDLQDVPTYTLPEASRSLAIPHRTLHYWFVGPRAILKPSAYYGQAALLSFRDASEAYVLEILRSFYGFNLRTLAKVIENARLETKLRRPLIQADLRVVFNSVALNKPRRGRRSRYAVDLSSYPQFFIPELVDIVGKRVLKKQDTPYRLYPWRQLKTDPDSIPVTLDLDVMSGRAVITGTRIPITLVLGLKRSGRSVEDIARSYDLPPDTIAKALQHIEQPLSKVA